MPIYVLLMNWKDQGVRADRDTVGRREHADALAEKYGEGIGRGQRQNGDPTGLRSRPDAGDRPENNLRDYDHEQETGFLVLASRPSRAILTVGPAKKSAPGGQLLLAKSR